MIVIYATIMYLSLVVQSFIIVGKSRIEEIENKGFILNIIILFVVITSIIFTYENNTLFLKFTILCFLLDIIVIIDYIYFKKKSINRNIIKQTVDSSSCGILAFDNKNVVSFQNKTMYDILKKLNIYDNYIKNIEKKATEITQNKYLLLIEDKAYLFCINNDKKEITSFDISEEYKLQQELKRQNEILKVNNEKIMWTIENIEILEKEEKALKLKNKFHDTLGQQLSILVSYLNQNINDAKKFNEIKFMINKMFIENDEESDPYKNLEDLIKLNKNVGVNIILKGYLPKDIKLATVYFEIIREAVTNAIKHAESNIINIRIYNNEMTITNNGKKVKENTTEHEGIKGMRRKVKAIGGKIYIYKKPKFMIKITI